MSDADGVECLGERDAFLLNASVAGVVGVQQSEVDGAFGVGEVCERFGGAGLEAVPFLSVLVPYRS
ncbi:hypothetical protein BJF83_24360 [Nocardiopsis sp. CNR-923]|nr:hypothetical protein BJF83_24360 [Nocardiopsis sp. CNR-923]